MSFWTIVFLDPVYTRSKYSGFVTNPKCFDIGFVLSFTLARMNPIQYYPGYRLKPELSNPEKFVENLYPEKYNFKQILV